MRTPYQFKLDLGEGPECHEVYQEFLHAYDKEDTVEAWVDFCESWTVFMQVRALEERDSTGQVLQ